MAKTLLSSDIYVVRNSASTLFDTGGWDGGDVDDNDLFDNLVIGGADIDNIF